jgi:transcriptional regulator with XRE-family HTH domain
MARTLNAVIGALPKEERDAVEARARALIAEEMSLQEVRKAMGKTQVTVAKRLGLRQDGVSKIETRTDMLISTLRNYLKAIGGDLELVARFPDKAPVRLVDFKALSPRRKHAAKRNRRAHSEAVV